MPRNVVPPQRSPAPLWTALFTVVYLLPCCAEDRPTSLAEVSDDLLFEQLGAEDFGVREKALEEVIPRGSSIIPKLEKNLATPHVQLRDLTTRALDAIRWRPALGALEKKEPVLREEGGKRLAREIAEHPVIDFDGEPRHSPNVSVKPDERNS